MKTNLSILFLFLAFLSRGQNNFESGIKPKIGLNTKYKKFKFQGVYASNHRFYKSIGNEYNINEYKHKKSELTLIATHKLSVFSKLGIGYQYDFVNKAHTIIQQYTNTHKGYRFIYGHRMRTDQQFKDGEISRLRVRYRFSLTNPLNGTSLDEKEFYLKYTIENIYINKTGKSDLENQNSLALGFYISGSDKIELGALMKSGQLLSTYQKFQLWGTVNWYLSINTSNKKNSIDSDSRIKR